MNARRTIIAIGLVLAACVAAARAQDLPAKSVDKWITAEGAAAGSDAKAKDAAVAKALRTAVEQACGVFLTAQSNSRNYKAIYDKVFADTVGYVRQYHVVKTWLADGVTHVKVNARVSTKKFRADWAAIAHTLEQENNPRVIVAIVEAVQQTTAGPVYEAKESGIVQTIIEQFFLSKGLTLMDKGTSEQVKKRDVLLAVIKDDTKEIAALGARFKADVVVVGRASAKHGRTIDVAGQRMHQFVATLNVRVIRTDSAQILVAKSIGPVTTNTMQQSGGEDKALAKLGKQAAPEILEAVIQAWSKQINVRRQIQLSISGMDYALWKKFQPLAQKIDGVQAVRLREITEGVATIDVETAQTNLQLADRLIELKEPKLSVTEITANRIKLKVVATPAASDQ